MKKTQTHIMYGFVTGLAMVIFGVVLYVADLAFQSWSQWVTYVPFLIGLILNAQAYAKANDHFVTYGQVWSSGFKASAVITLVLVAWGLVSMFVFPEMREKGMEIARESMIKNGMEDEQIDQAIEMSQKFYTPFMMGGIVFGTMIVGAILSAVAAGIPKKKGDGMPPVAQH